MARAQRIAIVGAGFAGIHAYQTLHKKLHGTGRTDITVINPTDYFGFTPLIHEVATGGMLPHGLSQPLRALPRCCIDNFILGTAQEVDCTRQTVRVRKAGTPGDPDVPGDDFVDVPYDYLILAMGSQTNFFSVPGTEQYTHELNNLEHARRLKNHIIECFEHAHTLRDPDAQKRELCFVIVGGGPTGVEFAGELSDFAASIAGRFYPHLAAYVRILLVERGEQLLKRGIEPWFSNKATIILTRKKGVYILYETAVEKVAENGIHTNRGFINARTVVWAAGVVARAITFTGKHKVECEDRSCRVRVNRYLQVPDHTNVFVVGDQAWVRNHEKDEPYPMRAQFAVREGKRAAENIVHMMNNTKLRSFRFREKGMIVSLGKGGALARMFGVHFSGPLAWFMYRTVYLFSMIGWKTRLRVILEWTLGLFSPRDASKV